MENIPQHKRDSEDNEHGPFLVCNCMMQRNQKWHDPGDRVASSPPPLQEPAEGVKLSESLRTTAYYYNKGVSK